MCSAPLEEGRGDSSVILNHTVEGKCVKSSCERAKPLWISEHRYSVLGLPHLVLSGWPEPVQCSRSGSQMLRVAGHQLYSTHPTTAHCRKGREALSMQGYGSYSTCMLFRKCVDRHYLFTDRIVVKHNFLPSAYISINADVFILYVLYVCITHFYFLYLFHFISLPPSFATFIFLFAMKLLLSSNFVTTFWCFIHLSILEALSWAL